LTSISISDQGGSGNLHLKMKIKFFQATLAFDDWKCCAHKGKKKQKTIITHDNRPRDASWLE
jgi:hypothetical protein